MNKKFWKPILTEARKRGKENRRMIVKDLKTKTKDTKKEILELENQLKEISNQIKEIEQDDPFSFVSDEVIDFIVLPRFEQTIDTMEAGEEKVFFQKLLKKIKILRYVTHRIREEDGEIFVSKRQHFLGQIGEMLKIPLSRCQDGYSLSCAGDTQHSNVTATRKAPQNGAFLIALV